MKNKIFIVPDNDLEARTIQQVLDKNGYRKDVDYFVTKQGWGASWEKLEPKILEKVNNIYKKASLEYDKHNHAFIPTIKVFGVELSGNKPVEDWVDIDHHKYKGDDRTRSISSLEQVAQVIDYSLSNNEWLVAENDKKGIKGIEDYFEDELKGTLTNDYNKYLFDEMDKRGYKVKEGVIERTKYNTPPGVMRHPNTEDKDIYFKNASFKEIKKEENKLKTEYFTIDLDLSIVTPDNKIIEFKDNIEYMGNITPIKDRCYILDNFMNDMGEKNILSYDEFEDMFKNKLITKVRTRERIIQGITKEQEQQAEAAIKNIVKYDNGLQVVHCEHSKSAPITDRLHGTYDNLLIVSKDGEYNFFGKSEICDELFKKYEGWAGDTKGQESTFWGGYPKDEKEVIEFINKTINEEKMELNKNNSLKIKDTLNITSKIKKTVEYFADVLEDYSKKSKTIDKTIDNNRDERRQ